MKKIVIFAGIAVAAACGLYFSGVYPAKTGPEAQGAIGQRDVYRAPQASDVAVAPGSAPVANSVDALKQNLKGLDALKQQIARFEAMRASMSPADALRAQMKIQNEFKQNVAAMDAFSHQAKATSNLTSADAMRQQLAIQNELKANMAAMDALRQQMASASIGGFRQ